MGKRNNLVSNIIDDFNQTCRQLSEMQILRSYNGLSTNRTGNDCYELTWSNRNDEVSVLYNDDMVGAEIIEKLILENQFSLLLEDGSIFQFECIIKENQIFKQRMLFFKVSNKVIEVNKPKLMKTWEDYQMEDVADEQSTEMLGIPILIRQDYDMKLAKECIHPKSHFSIGNIKSCRIPMKANISFSEFVNFVLCHIYDCPFDFMDIRLRFEEDMFEKEKSMIHFNWLA